MATDLKLTEGHDIEYIDGDFNVVTEGTEVAQSSKIYLLTVEAEWFLNYLIGMPWFDEIMKVKTSLEEKERLIKNEILTVDGLREIVSFELGFDPESHSMSVEYEADTEYGEIQVRVET
jgi:hypothetical protein